LTFIVTNKRNWNWWLKVLLYMYPVKWSDFLWRNFNNRILKMLNARWKVLTGEGNWRWKFLKLKKSCRTIIFVIKLVDSKCDFSCWFQDWFLSPARQAPEIVFNKISRITENTTVEKFRLSGSFCNYLTADMKTK
jgi:hypothetical protein